MNFIVQGVALVRNFSFSDLYLQLATSQWLTQARALLLLVDNRIWYLLLFSVASAVLSRLVIEILVPAEQPPPATAEAHGHQPPPITPDAAAQQRPASVLEPNPDPDGRRVVDVSVSDTLRRRLRQLELECDGLRAEAQRACCLEAELAAAHIRIEQLTHNIASSQSARTPSAPILAAAAAATPSFFDGTPCKIAHRTPISAATKSFTVRASVLHKAQVTPSAPSSQPRFLGADIM
jgi:hypothetical protein